MPLTQYMLTIIGFSLISGVLAIMLTRLSTIVVRFEEWKRFNLTLLSAGISIVTSYFGLAVVLAVLHPDWSRLVACCFLSLLLSLIMPISLFLYAGWSRFEKLVCVFVARKCG